MEKFFFILGKLKFSNYPELKSENVISLSLEKKENIYIYSATHIKSMRLIKKGECLNILDNTFFCL